MAFKSALFRYGLGSAGLIVFLLSSASGKAPRQITSKKDRMTVSTPVRFLSGELESPGASYQWNIGVNGLPLLGLTRERLRPGFDQILTYPAGQFDFSIFKSLQFDETQGKYLLPVISKSTRNLIFVEFNRTSTANNYTTGSGLQLTDKGSMKIIQTAEGARFLFIEYPDGEFRCATIRENGGGVLNLLYAANGLALHGVVDAVGRSVTFNYGKEGVESLTQTWMSNLEGFTRTWSVDDDSDSSLRFAHAVVRTGKFLPANAVMSGYSPEMLASDQILARIFGGPGAVAGGNGFEPAGLGASYPFYRGDIIGDDGKLRLGHLSHAIHLYGSADGRGDSALYVPAGFSSHSSEPTPTDAAMTFYYPRLGNLTDITLAVFHISEFQIVPEGDRIRIGKIGGPGGSSPLYRHSHIEFYRGNTGLPAAAARASLRIDPATVFGPQQNRKQ